MQKVIALIPYWTLDKWSFFCILGVTIYQHITYINIYQHISTYIPTSTIYQHPIEVLNWRSLLQHRWLSWCQVFFCGRDCQKEAWAAAKRKSWRAGRPGEGDRWVLTNGHVLIWSVYVQIVHMIYVWIYTWYVHMINLGSDEYLYEQMVTSMHLWSMSIPQTSPIFGPQRTINYHCWFCLFGPTVLEPPKWDSQSGSRSQMLVRQKEAATDV